MKRLAVLMLAVGLAWSAPAAEPSPTELAWAAAEQEQFPSWEGRRAAAEARTAARTSWFEGEVSFEVAFPAWAGSPVNRVTAVRGRLSELDRAQVDRALERQVEPPDVGVDARRQRWLQRRAQVLAAEDAADEAERRMLVGVLALLENQPHLRASRLASIRTPWEATATQVIEGEVPDEQRAAIESAARRADRWLRQLDEGVSNAVLLGARGQRAPLPAGLVDSLSDPAEAEAAALMLERLVPTAPSAERDTAGQALAAWWSSRSWPDPVASDTTRVEALLAQSPIEGAWTEARRQALEARLATLREAEAKRQAQPDDTAEQARRAGEEAALAAAEAEAAMASAEDARARLRAEVLRSLAGSRQRGADLLGEAEAAETRANLDRERFEEAIAGIDTEILAIRNRRLGEAAPDPDGVYQKVRGLAQELRAGPVARGQRLAEARRRQSLALVEIHGDRAEILERRSWADLLTEPLVQAEVTGALDAWSEELDQEERTGQAMVDAAMAERDDALAALNRLREQRRTLRGWISTAEWNNDRGYLLNDIVQELSLLGPTVWMRVRLRFDDALALPGRLTDFNLLRGLVGATFWTLLWMAAWVWTRGQADNAARAIGRRLLQFRPELRPGDIRLLEDPVARSLRAVVDLLLGYALVGRLGNLMPELGFLLLVYLQIALYRALLAAFDLVVIPQEQVRPAVLVLRAESHALARKTVRFLIALFIARSFADHLLWDVLGLDVIAGLVGTAFGLGLLWLVVWALARWEPFLRARVAARNQDSAVVAFLAKEPEGALVQPLRGGAQLLFFGVVWTVELAMWIARERSGLAWLLLLFSRIGKDEDGPELAPLPDVVVRALLEEGGPLQIERDEVRDEVGLALDRWKESHRRGMLAMIGDRGSQMGLACKQIRGLCELRQLELSEVQLDRRLITEAQMLAWLAEGLALEPCDEPDRLVEQLLARPGRVWVLRDLHHAWTRQVEGFEAMTTLLYVLNATSHHHFWVVTMHALTWEYFASPGVLVDVGVFASVVPLKPLTGPQIRALATQRTHAAGFRLDMTGLIRGSTFGGDPTIEEERGVQLFFRLLADVSRGNPSAAMRLWVGCLRPTDDPEVLLVYPGDALDASTVSGLGDVALFALVALRIQDELAEEELVQVTNIPRPMLRATLRDLIARGLVVREGESLLIPDSQLPAVSRTLRRRHFLHLGAP